MQQSNEFFATAKPLRLFFKVAMAGMVSMLAMSLYGVIEGAIIGQMLGEAAFAAINLAMPFVIINSSLADLIGVGSSVPISVSLGRKEEDKANNIFTCSLIMIVAVSFCTGTFFFFSAPGLMRLMGAEGELAALAVRYVRVYALMAPVTTVTFAFDNYLRISGFVKGSMFLNIFMSCLTVALILLFIGGFGMNAEGSALAACISFAVCAMIAFIPFLRKKAILKLVRPKFSWPMIRQIISCGTPVFLNNVAGRVAAIMMNSALLRIGGPAMGQTAVAAYSVMMYTSSIIEPMLYGISDSVQPAVGYNWGARQLHRARDITKCAFTACGIVSVIGTAAMLFFTEPIVGLFVEAGDTALIEMSVHAMKFFCIAYLFRWFGFAVQGFFSAIEKPLPASILSVCSAMVFPIVFIFVLNPLGLDGLWLNMAATSFAVMVMAVVMLRVTQGKMKKNLGFSKDTL